jgi:error-prone DNA polymerase
VRELIGFPRHLSQHVGGFVISRRAADELVPDRERRDAGPHRHPVGQGRSGVARLLKVDVLALGMLTAMQRCFALIAGIAARLRMQDIPAEDPATYDMICRAETVGVFQIESGRR